MQRLAYYLPCVIIITGAMVSYGIAERFPEGIEIGYSIDGSVEQVYIRSFDQVADRKSAEKLATEVSKLPFGENVEVSITAGEGDRALAFLGILKQDHVTSIYMSGVRIAEGANLDCLRRFSNLRVLEIGLNINGETFPDLRHLKDKLDHFGTQNTPLTAAGLNRILEVVPAKRIDIQHPTKLREIEAIGVRPTRLESLGVKFEGTEFELKRARAHLELILPGVVVSL